MIMNIKKIIWLVAIASPWTSGHAAPVQAEIGGKAAVDLKNVSFGYVSAFRDTSGGDHLFLGSNAAPGDNKKEYSLARADFAEPALANQQPTLTAVGITPADGVTVYNSANANGLPAQANPLYQKALTNFAVGGTADAPWVAVTGNVQVLGAAGARDSVDVVTVLDPLGTGVSQSNVGALAVEVKDAANNALAAGKIVGLAGGQKTVWAAVSQSDKANFKDALGTNRGIAVIRKNANLFTPKKAAALGTAAGNEQAAKIDAGALQTGNSPTWVLKTATNPITTADIGSNNVALYWDNPLQCLYCGLESVARDVSAKEGGVMSVLLGRFQEDAVLSTENKDDATANYKFQLASVVSGLTQAQFYDATHKNVDDIPVGFYFDGVSVRATDPTTIYNDGRMGIRASTHKINAMHTCTGRHYLIAATSKENPAAIGGLPGGLLLLQQRVFQLCALPLISAAGLTNGTIAAVDTNGIMVDPAAAPAALANMPRTYQAPVKVGGDYAQWTKDTIKNFAVAGDSVYVFGDATLGNLGKGIFRSTALFGSSGAIIGWTQPTHVIWDRTIGGMFYPDFASYVYVKYMNRDAAPVVQRADTVAMTWWGASALDASLTALFPATKGGVLGMAAFDEYTPGFVPGCLSALVTFGSDSIAIVKTGQGNMPDNFGPVTTFVGDQADANRNIFYFDSTALNGVTYPCTAEMSRLNGANNNWFFVGGNGLAVLRIGATGVGFNPLGDITAATVNGFTFKKLTPTNGGDFSIIRKLVAAPDATGATSLLYVMTNKSVYVIDMAAGKFDDVVTTPLGEQKLNTAMDGCLCDMVYAGSGTIIPAGTTTAATFRAFFIATSKGLFKLVHWREGTVDKTMVYEVALIDSSNTSLTGQPIIQLNYLTNSKGIPGKVGNLYVMTGSMAVEPTEGATFILSVDMRSGTGTEGWIKDTANKTVTIDFDRYRGNIVVDGPVMVHTRNTHFGSTDFVQMRYRNTSFADLNKDYDLDAVLGVDESKMPIVGVPARDDATGMLLIPTQQGIKANQ